MGLEEEDGICPSALIFAAVESQFGFHIVHPNLGPKVGEGHYLICEQPLHGVKRAAISIYIFSRGPLSSQALDMINSKLKGEKSGTYFVTLPE